MAEPDQAIGFIGMGEMGASIARCMTAAGHEVCAVAAGRSRETIDRMVEARVEPLESRRELLERCGIVFSVIPPSEAEPEAAATVEALRVGARITFVEANAIAPARAARIASLFDGSGSALVDAGIVGVPPSGADRPRLYASGPDVPELRELDGTGFDLVHLGPEIGRASAFKMAYAAATKGTNSVLTAVLLAAELSGFADEFEREFSESQPILHRRAHGNIARLPSDAGRWIFEMEEIASAFRSLGLPGGFHDAASEIMTLLSESEFGSETRRTRDKSRTAAATVSSVAKQILPKSGR